MVLAFQEPIVHNFSHTTSLNPCNTPVHSITSAFAQSEHENLLFRLDDNGMDLMSTDYSQTLCDMIEEYLARRGSLPAFLCTLNVELFNRTTQAMEAMNGGGGGEAAEATTTEMMDESRA